VLVQLSGCVVLLTDLAIAFMPVFRDLNSSMTPSKCFSVAIHRVLFSNAGVLQQQASRVPNLAKAREVSTVRNRNRKDSRISKSQEGVGCDACCRVSESGEGAGVIESFRPGYRNCTCGCGCWRLGYAEKKYAEHGGRP
jgi:hypothetical protein